MEVRLSKVYHHTIQAKATTMEADAITKIRGQVEMSVKIAALEEFRTCRP